MGNYLWVGDFLIQWGRHPVNGGYQINFPIAFPNACLNVVLIPHDDGGAIASSDQQGLSFVIAAVDKTYFTIHQRYFAIGMAGPAGIATQGCYWQAIGN